MTGGASSNEPGVAGVTGAALAMGLAMPKRLLSYDLQVAAVDVTATVR